MRNISKGCEEEKKNQKPTKKPNQNKKFWSHLKQIMLSKTVVLMALHLRYIHSNCGRWFLFWKSFTRLPSSDGEALLCQRDLPEAGQQLANISEQAGPATGSVFTNDNSCEQRSHHCLGNSPHHQSDLLPRWNFYWFIYFIFFSWTEKNQAPRWKLGNCTKVSNEIKSEQCPIQTD